MRDGHLRQHAAVWAAIDGIAAGRDTTPSGLARRAGLDATAFNKSKRVKTDGEPRWPSTETIAKVIGSIGMSFAEFGALVDAEMERPG